MKKTYRYSDVIDSREYDDPCMLAEILVLKDWSAEEKEIIYNHFKKVNKEFVPIFRGLNDHSKKAVYHYE